MRISDIVAQYILDMLNDESGVAEIQRNELASSIGCVPSQINYVITSRFTPEHGYIVESRRGGGGFIRITRVDTAKDDAIMLMIRAVGDSIDRNAADLMIRNMKNRNMISDLSETLFSAAISDRSLAAVPKECRDSARASILKNMLLVIADI